MTVSLRARTFVRQCPVPLPWSIEAYVDQVAHERKRPILLRDEPASPTLVTGETRVYADYDLIRVRDDLRGIHREHVICHEIAHLIAGHVDGVGAPVSEDLAGAASQMLAHTAYRTCDHDTPKEREAEALAELIIRRVAQATRGGYAAGLL